ncbi:MAG: general secretion pathway protein GspB, partial [Gammaproteobacteria bacterium]|nr:general secretion pathway protein GspB [Gammaproteobacteria bacterium]
AMPAETPAASGAGTSHAAGFSEQVAAARQNAPPRDEPRPAAVDSAPPETRPFPAPPTSSIALPTIHELVASGAISVPELHVDVHVYSEARDDRFVFINMNKHIEGSRLAEGPLIREITPEGVVLVQDGKTFLLPRD